MFAHFDKLNANGKDMKNKFSFVRSKISFNKFRTSAITIIIFIIVITIIYLVKNQSHNNHIKVGILHSLTGDLAISEKPVANATLLAIKEINQAGGILHKQIEPILVDCKSDEHIFAQEAERLITQEHVAALFGCWTSPSRIAVKDVVEKHNSLLFYPVQFEGIENSQHIVYASTTPNQQIIPGITWCMQHLGKKFFLVGSDLLLHEIMKDVISAYDGTMVGEAYFALNNTHVDDIIKNIINAKPDVILNNIEGEPNIAFFNALRAQGITPEKIPTMSFSVSEPELKVFKTDSMTGDYATWSYFESIDNAENKTFIKKVQQAYGNDHGTSDAMEAAYYSVYLWKQAIEKAHSTQTDLVIPALNNQAFDAPQGLIHITEESLGAWQFFRIGKIRSDKQFTILWSSEKAIRPLAYPPTRTVSEWNDTRANIDKKENKK
jgi:urea transport system substrate-binding protein